MNCVPVILALFLSSRNTHNGWTPSALKPIQSILESLFIPGTVIFGCCGSPKTKGDMEKLVQGSAITLRKRTPLPRIHWNAGTNQTVIAGMGELTWQDPGGSLCFREFNVEAKTSALL